MYNGANSSPLLLLLLLRYPKKSKSKYVLAFTFSFIGRVPSFALKRPNVSAPLVKMGRRKRNSRNNNKTAASTARCSPKWAAKALLSLGSLPGLLPAAGWVSGVPVCKSRFSLFRSTHFFFLSLFSSLTLFPSFFLFLPLSFSPGRVSALNILGSVNTRRDGRAVKVRTRNDEKTLL